MFVLENVFVFLAIDDHVHELEFQVRFWYDSGTQYDVWLQKVGHQVEFRLADLGITREQYQAAEDQAVRLGRGRVGWVGGFPEPEP